MQPLASRKLCSSGLLVQILFLHVCLCLALLLGLETSDQLVTLLISVFKTDQDALQVVSHRKFDLEINHRVLLPYQDGRNKQS